MYKVLYLEDEDVLVEYLPELLKEKGFYVIATTSIENALQLFANELFDVVLLDIMMQPAEDMDLEKLEYGLKTGLEVARRMKALKPDVPIAAFSVAQDDEILNELAEAGITNRIQKPAEIDQIAEKLLTAVRQKK